MSMGMPARFPYQHFTNEHPSQAPRAYELIKRSTEVAFDPPVFAAGGGPWHNQLTGTEVGHSGELLASDLSPPCVDTEFSHGLWLHGGVGKRGFPGASSSGQTIAFLPSCH